MSKTELLVRDRSLVQALGRAFDSGQFEFFTVAATPSSLLCRALSRSYSIAVEVRIPKSSAESWTLGDHREVTILTSQISQVLTPIQGHMEDEYSALNLSFGERNLSVRVEVEDSFTRTRVLRDCPEGNVAWPNIDFPENAASATVAKPKAFSMASATFAEEASLGVAIRNNQLRLEAGSDDHLILPAKTESTAKTKLYSSALKCVGRLCGLAQASSLEVCIVEDGLARMTVSISGGSSATYFVTKMADPP